MYNMIINIVQNIRITKVFMHSYFATNNQIGMEVYGTPEFKGRIRDTSPDWQDLSAFNDT